MPQQRKRSRKRYSANRRAEIIATADKEGLTATDVQKRFGVIPVTYYSWRKKSKGIRRGGASGPGRRLAASEGRLRERVRAQLERRLPQIVEDEISRYISGMFGTGGRRGRR